MTALTKIEIVYCAPCGYLDRAVSLAGKILQQRDDHIEELALVPADLGVFDVSVDGKLVFSKERAGRFPDAAEITGHIALNGGRELPEGAACPLPE